MFLLQMPTEWIIGASPEMLVKCSGDSLEYRPIAGTRRRGKTVEEDNKLADEMRGDQKEVAEHQMLVDLGRNDLGRVAEYGSVKVDELMGVEKYSHVQHLVSKLSARLRNGLDRFDALASCFPAGTVSGAPKVRAIEIIQELEPTPRGIYAGSVGYFDYAGNMDTCIAIRTLVLRDGVAHVQAGAGIVADSVPELEYQETVNKARALLKAIELAESQPL
jgi:anthranilate synthase component 1